jgi:hypothetical protein
VSVIEAAGSADAALAARAALHVGDAIARSHEGSLREAGAGSPQGQWIRARLSCELEAARAGLRRVLADDLALDDAAELAEALQLCRIWRGLDSEFAVSEGTVVRELAARHSISP